MNYQDVMEHQADLFAHAARPGMLEFMWGMRRTHPDFQGLSIVGGFKREEETLAPRVRTRVLDMVQLGEPYAVSREVTDLIATAAPDLPDHATINPLDLPSRYGFLLFDRPLPLTHRDTIEPGPEQDVPFAGFAWEVNEAASQVVVLLIADWRNEQKGWEPRIKFDFAPIGLHPFTAGMTLTQEMGLPEVADLLPDNKQRLREMIRYVFTTALFLGQSIVVPSRRPIDRAARKRLERKRWTHVANPEVLFVELRRIAHKTAPAGNVVEHDFRWWVSAHFRTFWTGPGRTIPVVKYLHPFIKGPADRPLRDPRPRVFLVKR